MASDGTRFNEFQPNFSNSIRHPDGHLQEILDHAPDWSIEAELSKPGPQNRVHAAEFSQPLCTVIQIALVDTFAAPGTGPDAVVGYSSG